VERREHAERFTELQERVASYEVYDRTGEKIGKVDALFLDEADQPEYIGVETGLPGASSALIPWDMVSVDEARLRFTVASDKRTVENGPVFGENQEITPELENRVSSHYHGQGHGQGRATTTGERGAHGAYYSDAQEERTQLAADERSEVGGYRGYGGREGAGSTRGTTGRAEVAREDEIRVQRTEEELLAGTREREAGAVKVRKRVRVDRERLEVPTRREEAVVERVPIDKPAGGAQIGEDEVRVPLTEEEVVVEKRPVAKEEIRLRKDVVEDVEVVEADVRREEIDVEDTSTTRRTDDRGL